MGAGLRDRSGTIGKTLGHYARAVINRAPYVRGMVAKLRHFERFCPLDHFYSPIPSMEEMRRRESEIFGPPPADLADVDLNLAGQRELLGEFKQYDADFDFPAEAGTQWRYHHGNQFFGLADGLILFCFLRHLRPRRIIEVGSGFSSCLTLDTAERFLGGQLDCTFIEPDAVRLNERARPGDLKKARLISKPAQEVGVDVFAPLEAGDILFIDSSHVAKAGSDVNFLFFEVLPRLPGGVYVHIHDIFYPFEYPKSWVVGGRSFNEAYLVRAMLQSEENYSIVCFLSHLQAIAAAELERTLPRCLTARGQSLWLRKN